MTGVRRIASIDTDAISGNIARLKRKVGTPHLMAVVKADGYGHGAVRSATAALRGGADWLGVADIAEALSLRDAGIDAPVLAWLHDSEVDFVPAIDRGIDIGVSTIAHLEALAQIRSESVPDIHLKIETGLNRNGFSKSDWHAAVDLAARLQAEGLLRVRGIFSHLANASAADDTRAIAAFVAALDVAHSAGLEPEVTHLASTAGAIRRPDARFDLVRIGIGMYGLSPFDDGEDLGLTPAMSLTTSVANVRRVAEGDGVSYDLTWRAPSPTTLALVPLGYADGVPRAASGRAEVSIRGRRCPVRGRIAMDQFVVDVGDGDVGVGDEVVVFGDPGKGHPGADDWARWSDSINYEIVTRIGARVRRLG